MGREERREGGMRRGREQIEGWMEEERETSRWVGTCLGMAA